VKEIEHEPLEELRWRLADDVEQVVGHALAQLPQSGFDALGRALTGRVLGRLHW